MIPVGTVRKDGYIAAAVKGKQYLLHRLAFFYVNGYMPVEIDHINGIRSDNRISNLREVDHKENTRNRNKRDIMLDRIKAATRLQERRNYEKFREFEWLDDRSSEEAKLALKWRINMLKLMY